MQTQNPRVWTLLCGILHFMDYSLLRNFPGQSADLRHGRSRASNGASRVFSGIHGSLLLVRVQWCATLSALVIETRDLEAGVTTATLAI